MPAALRKRAPVSSSRSRRTRSTRQSRASLHSHLTLATDRIQPLPAAPARHLQTVPTPFQPSGKAQILAVLNTGLSMVSSLLVVSALGVYGYSVYIDRQLDQATEHLAKLQRSEQQLTTVNEVLKNHIAEQTEKSNLGLQPPQPKNVIFLKPAQQRVAANPSGQVDPHASQLPQLNTPLGY